MDSEEQFEIMLDQLREDLTDGQDLALAARLVGDALTRRMRRARETLAHLEQMVEGGRGAFGLEPDELASRIRVLQERTVDFEREMRSLADRLTDGAESYEHELGGLIANIDDEGAAERDQR